MGVCLKLVTSEQRPDVYSGCGHFRDRNKEVRG